ncbi:MAG: hypothetical protein AB1454_13500 [Candidatus Auribacterota bacterium]
MDIDRNLGEQPIARIMSEHHLSPHDIVASSTEQITHKMVSRAMKGRRLTPNVQAKIVRALNTASSAAYTASDLFTY